MRDAAFEPRTSRQTPSSTTGQTARCIPGKRRSRWVGPGLGLAWRRMSSGLGLAPALVLFPVLALAVALPSGCAGKAKQKAAPQNPEAQSLEGDPELQDGPKAPGNARVYAPVEQLVAQGEYAQAVDKADELLQTHPKEAGLYYAKAAALQRLDRSDEAHQAFLATIEHDPAFAPAYTALAREYAFGRFDFKKGLEYAKKAHELGPDDPEAIMVLAMILHDLDDSDQAMKLLESVASKPKASPALGIELSRLYAAKGRWPEATKTLQQAIENAPEEEQIAPRLLLGRYYLAQKKFKAARESFSLAMQGAPEDWDVRLAVVRALIKAEQLAAAEEELGPVIQALPGEAPVLVARGQLRAAQKRYTGKDGALHHFDAALKEAPQSVAAHYHRSLALVAMGRCAEAKQSAAKLRGEKLGSFQRDRLQSALAKCR